MPPTRNTPITNPAISRLIIEPGSCDVRSCGLDFPSICKVTGGNLVHMSHERINDPGIELGSGPIFYHLYSFLYRPGFPIWSRANDGIEDVRNRHDATRERDRLALYSHRISSSIPPLMVSQSNLLGQSQET